MSQKEREVRPKKAVTGNMLCAGEREEGKDKKELLGTGILRTDVIAVIFSDTLEEMPPQHWDVSAQGDGSTAAWIQTQEEGVVVYIAGEGGVAGNPDCRNLFRNCSRLKEIRFQGCFDTSKVTDMECMFYGCTSLEELDLSGFDTSLVLRMGGMFGQCRSLAKLDISSFDTRQVTDMKFMFGNCRSLEELDVSGFDTAQVTDMKGMFGGCCKLKRLDVGGFETSCVTDMKDMFKGCQALDQLDTGGFDMSLVQKEEGMYDGLGSTAVLAKGEKLLQKNLLRADEMQAGYKRKSCFLGTQIRCTELAAVIFLDTLEEMPREHWEVSAAGDGSVQAWAEKDGNGYRFYIAGEGGVTANPNCRDLFRDCAGLREVCFNSCLDTSQVRDMSRMFWNCSRLEELAMTGLDTSRVKDMSFLFAGCMSLKRLSAAQLDTSRVLDMKGMFYNCSNLTELDTGGFHTSRVKDMEKMFAGCSSLRQLDVRGFDTSRVVSMRSMFAGCRNLAVLDMSSFVLSEEVDQEDMLIGCSSLSG